jgi:hypothetical protein
VAHGTCLSFSSNAAIEAVGLSQASIDDGLLGLLGPYHQYAIGTFNTCSRGPTHRSLTDTGGDYNLRHVGFSHTTPRPFQPMGFTFHLRVPPGLQLNHIPSTKPKFKFKESKAVTWSSDHSVIYHNLHLRLAIANDIFLALGFTRIDRKVT